MSPFSSDTLFPGIEFMTFDACTSDNCHGSCPVSFLYFLYKLERILSVKTLGNPLNLACQSRYSGVNILSDLVMLPFSMIVSQFKSLSFSYIHSKKKD